MFSLHPGPTIKISSPLAWQPVEQFCGRVKLPFIANDPASDSYRLGNFQQNHFKFPTSSRNSGGLAKMLFDFNRSNEIKLEINQTVFDKMVFYSWYKKKTNNEELSLEDFKTNVKEEDFKTFLKEKGISEGHLNILETHYDQCLTSPLAASITSLIIQPKTNSTCGALPTKQCYFNFDESDKIHFESRLSIEITDTSIPPNTFELGVVGCKGACDLNSGAHISDVGCSNSLLEDVIAENIPDTFAAFKQKAELHQFQETTAQKHYQSLYAALEPILTKLNPAYTMLSEKSKNRNPEIAFASDLTRPLLNLEGFTGNLVKQISDKIPGIDREKNQNRLDYYFGLRKKPRGFRNSHEIAHFEKIIKAAKELNQTYDNWCVNPLDMQRLREVKLKLLQLHSMVETIANDYKLPASSELKKHVQNELIKKNSPFIPIYEQLDTLVETLYNTPQIYRDLKQKKQVHLLLEISPLAAAMQDEDLVSGVLNRDAEARKEPSRLDLQCFRLQPGQTDKILQKYQHHLEVQYYFSKPENANNLKEEHKKQEFFQSDIDNKQLRTLLSSTSLTPEQYQKIFFSDALLDKYKFSPIQNPNFLQRQKQQSFILKQKPQKIINAKKRNLKFALTHYSTKLLQEAYHANLNNSFAYIQKSSLYFRLKQANETELVTAWRNNPAISALFALDKNIAIELMKENVHLAVFFMDNAKARKQAKLEKIDFESCYEKHKTNQNFIDRLIKNKIYRDWVNESNVKREHSSRRWIFRKPSLIIASNSDASYSYLIESRRFDQIKFPVSLDLKFSDAQRIVLNCNEISLKVLFNALFENKANLLKKNIKSLNNIIKRSLIPTELDQLNTSTDKAELKLAALIRENSELALTMAEYLEKRYYAENPKENLLEQLVELACADRSGKVAERLLVTSVWKRLLKTHPSTQLTAEQLEKIAIAHKQNAAVLSQISEESFFGYSHAAKIQANKVNVDLNALKLELAGQDKQLLTNGLPIQLLGKLIIAYEANPSLPDDQQIKFGASPSESITLALIKEFLKHVNWDSNKFDDAKAILSNTHWVNFMVENELLSTERLAELLAKPELRILIQLNYLISDAQAKALEKLWATTSVPSEMIASSRFGKIAQAAKVMKELIEQFNEQTSVELQPQEIPVEEVVAAVVDVPIMDRFLAIADSTQLMDFLIDDAKRNALFELSEPPVENQLFKIFEKFKTHKNSRTFLEKLTSTELKALFNNTTNLDSFIKLCGYKKSTLYRRSYSNLFEILEWLQQRDFAILQDPNKQQAAEAALSPFIKYCALQLQMKRYPAMLADPAEFSEAEIVEALLSKDKDYHDDMLANDKMIIIFLRASSDVQLAELNFSSELLLEVLVAACENADAFNKIWQKETIRTKILEINDPEQLAQLILVIEAHGDESSKELLKNGDTEKLAQAFQTKDFLRFKTLCTNALIRDYLKDNPLDAEKIRVMQPVIVIDNEEATVIWSKFKEDISIEEQDVNNICQLVAFLASSLDEAQRNLEEVDDPCSPDEAQRNPGEIFSSSVNAI